ncbi:MAG: hypothetical protein C5B59_06210 [Bacteroidetes bacterium]|nr:MAG: hypothetical protein C5B59_06210 [Bacteroidota bacterium]
MLKQYVIAIGGSAGSLFALRKFFDHTPLNNASYVILRHLPLDYKSALNNILKQHSKLKVEEAKRGASIQNDCVYYASPGNHLIIEDGSLEFVSRVKESRNRQIDIFLESLARNENKRKSIAIILSGTGTDGVKGAAAIKKAGGTVIVQTPDSCEFPDLPSEVIKSGNADFIVPPEGMPAVIKRCLVESPVS